MENVYYEKVPDHYVGYELPSFTVHYISLTANEISIIELKLKELFYELTKDKKFA